MQNEKEEENANEPEVNYGQQINVFNSLEEMNDFNYKYWAQLKPEELLAIVTKMRLQRFPHLNTDIHPWGFTIYID